LQHDKEKIKAKAEITTSDASASSLARGKENIIPRLAIYSGEC